MSLHLTLLLQSPGTIAWWIFFFFFFCAPWGQGSGQQPQVPGEKGSAEGQVVIGSGGEQNLKYRPRPPKRGALMLMHSCNFRTLKQHLVANRVSQALMS